MELYGRVIKEPFAQGSKSERDAVMLDTGQGRYVLRREGGNPFADPTLDQLIGQTISGEGNLTGYTFIMSRWKILNEDPTKDRR